MLIDSGATMRLRRTATCDTFSHHYDRNWLQFKSATERAAYPCIGSATTFRHRWGPMLQFSTDLVPASDRFDAWHWNAQKICGDCHFRFPNTSRFHGSIEARPFGQLQFTRFSSSPLSFQKTPLYTVSSENVSYIVITQLQGTQSYCQGKAIVVLTPCDSTVLDSSLPWSSDSADPCARLYLRVPAWLMHEHTGANHLPLSKRINGRFGLGVALFNLATSLYEQAPVLNPDEEVSGLESFFHILSSCLGRSFPTAQTHSTNLRGRIATFIEANLTDPALTPSDIAAEAHISVRHLHRLFESQGRSVSDWIRERRLEQCRAALSDPCMENKSITEIAFSWGFSDSAHFSRSFRRSFGISPRQFRSQRSRMLNR